MSLTECLVDPQPRWIPILLDLPGLGTVPMLMEPTARLPKSMLTGEGLSSITSTLQQYLDPRRECSKRS